MDAASSDPLHCAVLHYVSRLCALEHAEPIRTHYRFVGLQHNLVLRDNLCLECTPMCIHCIFHMVHAIRYRVHIHCFPHRLHLDMFLV